MSPRDAYDVPTSPMKPKLVAADRSVTELMGSICDRLESLEKTQAMAGQIADRLIGREPQQGEVASPSVPPDDGVVDELAQIYRRLSNSQTGIERQLLRIQVALG